jgi:NAD(P)H dehydrogenase (quinone)
MWEHRQTEDRLRAVAPGWTILRNSVYAEILLRGAQAALASGSLVTNEGEGRVSYVARDDRAAAAAAVLATGGHEGKVYDITGPALLGAADVAALYAELGGRPVEVVQVDDEAYAAGLVEHAGMPEPVAAVYASFGTGTRRGYAAPVSDTVLRLTGGSPKPVRDVLAASRGAERAERLLDVGVRVGAMDLVEVDPVGVQPSQRGLHLAHDPAARSATRSAGSRGGRAR